MPHESHISTKAYDMAKAKMCAYSQSDHALSYRKYALRCCAQCPIINIPDQEIDDNHPNPSPSNRFQIYPLIVRCKKYSRLLLTDGGICCECQQDNASGQSTKICTRKELVMMETHISNFHTSFLFQQSRSWSFTFLMNKYWVRITVVTFA